MESPVTCGVVGGVARVVMDGGKDNVISAGTVAALETKPDRDS